MTRLRAASGRCGQTRDAAIGVEVCDLGSQGGHHVAVERAEDHSHRCRGRFLLLVREVPEVATLRDPADEVPVEFANSLDSLYRLVMYVDLCVSAKRLMSSSKTASLRTSSESSRYLCSAVRIVHSPKCFYAGGAGVQSTSRHPGVWGTDSDADRVDEVLPETTRGRPFSGSPRA